MNDLIHRDLLAAKLKHWREKLLQTYGENDEYVRCLDEVIYYYIEQAPVVEAEPVIHAHWKYWDGWIGNHDKRLEIECSHCGHQDCVREYGYDNIKHLPKWCFGCGAKMDEVSE